LHFEVEVISGELTLNEEATAFGFFSLREAENLDMHGSNARRRWLCWKNGGNYL
jgi:hypothetical protein